jgi:hypothetical protein
MGKSDILSSPFPLSKTLNEKLVFLKDRFYGHIVARNNILY